jgi:hypothetical protein
MDKPDGFANIIKNSPRHEIFKMHLRSRNFFYGYNITPLNKCKDLPKGILILGLILRIHPLTRNLREYP